MVKFAVRFVEKFARKKPAPTAHDDQLPLQTLEN